MLRGSAKTHSSVNKYVIQSTVLIEIERNDMCVGVSAPQRKIRLVLTSQFRAINLQAVPESAHDCPVKQLRLRERTTH